MFQESQSVKCVDEKMGGNLGAVLETEQTYTIKEFVPPEDCQVRFPNSAALWHNEGGRVELQEMPGSYWYGRRFQVAG